MNLAIRPSRGTHHVDRPVSVTDPRGAKTRFTYDFLNRVIAVTDPLGQAVQFEYDGNSNLTKVTDPRGGTIQYAYNNMDQLITRTDPLLRPETFGFDVGGNLTSFVDRKNQQTTWDPYDDLNRPTVVRFKNAGGVEVANLTYVYDAANRVQTLTDSVAGAITWGYDPLDRLISETTPGNNVVTYVPDDANRRASMTVSGQPQVSYTLDNADRLTQIARVGLNPAVFGYDNANRRTSLQLPNLVSIAYGYDDANRLTGLTYSGLVGGNQSLTYTYDPAGNRTAMGGSWARTILPDTISGASYDAANRQLTLGTKTMTYDDNGNLATLTDGGQTTHTWDVRDRLTNLSGPSLTGSFAYDAIGRRTQKTINSQSTTFQYNVADIIRESVGATPADYLRGLGIDEPLSRIESAGKIHYVPDALGSSFALSDDGGTVTTSYTYGPFGQTQASGAASANAFQYTGRENDGTGLYYYRARYYHPGLSRFIGEDPLGLQRGINLYEYVMNNPTGYTDPFGLDLGVDPDSCGSDTWTVLDALDGLEQGSETARAEIGKLRAPGRVYTIKCKPYRWQSPSWAYDPWTRTITIDPNWAPELCSEKGPKRPGLKEALGHEIRHGTQGWQPGWTVGDAEDDAVRVENLIRGELRLPRRTVYSPSLWDWARNLARGKFHGCPDAPGVTAP